MPSQFSSCRSSICLFLLVLLLNYLSDTICENICPRGEYDNFGTCLPCPRGTYGEVSGLTLPVCSNYCPKGRYNPTFRGKTVEDCTPCPPGRYGIIVGGTSVESACNGVCPAGKYSKEKGAIDISTCITCPTGYYDWQCNYNNRAGGSYNHVPNKIPWNDAL